MKIIPFILIAGFLLSACNQASPDRDPVPAEGTILVADDIIYDVIIKPPVEEDLWEQEKLKGYNGIEMINDLFDGIYSGELKVFDYSTGKPLSANKIKKIEASEGFERENIGKIQFTEKWSYDPATNNMEKKITSIVFGYESKTEGVIRTGYRAAFIIDFQ
ncbi:MAG: hypothetical protein K8R35_10180 [Bacteroidales bacterium]|nr:hypothetical protein [Bacteroidales bacterium]